MNDRCRVRTIRWRLLAACWLLAPAAVLAADPAKQTPPAKKGDGSAGVPPLLGSWDVQALFIRAPGDANVDAPNGWSQGRRYSATFTDKTLTLRLGTEVIAEMTYSWNSTSPLYDRREMVRWRHARHSGPPGQHWRQVADELE